MCAETADTSGSPLPTSCPSATPQAIFLKFDLFTKRLNKLIDMFTTIHQFSTLEQHTHIEGLEQMIKSLNYIIDDVKRKPYDLLDFFRNQVCGAAQCTACSTHCSSTTCITHGSAACLVGPRMHARSADGCVWILAVCCAR